jgi:hypothetical protein
LQRSPSLLLYKAVQESWEGMDTLYICGVGVLGGNAGRVVPEEACTLPCRQQQEACTLPCRQQALFRFSIFFTRVKWFAA